MVVPQLQINPLPFFSDLPDAPYPTDLAGARMPKEEKSKPG